MNEPISPVKKAKKVAAGRKGGIMRQAREREVIQAQRKKRIMELRMKGSTFAEIGQEIGLDRAGVWRLYDEALEELHGENQKLGERVRRQELHTMDRVEGRLMRMILDEKLKVREVRGDGSIIEMRDFDALNKLVASLVKVSERKARLAGADFPQQVEVAKKEGVTFEELVRIASAG